MIAHSKKIFPIVVVLGIWQCIVTISDVPHFILPGPDRILTTLWKDFYLLSYHAGVTFFEIISGLLIGIILGFASSLLIFMSQKIQRILHPIMILSQSVPIFVLAPLLILWLGYGIWVKIVTTVMVVYFPVTSAFFDALTRTPREWLEMAHIMTGSPMRILYRIRIPAALPGFASGVRIAAVYAPIGAIIGEWTGSSSGLGYIMLLANGQSRTDLSFAALMILWGQTIILHRIVNMACSAFLDSKAE